MPLLVLLLAVVTLLAVMVLSIPLPIIQRYRMGTARRTARGWIATINLLGIAISAAILLVIAVVSGPWVPKAIPYTLTGLAAGSVVIGDYLVYWAGVRRKIARYRASRP